MSIDSSEDSITVVNTYDQGHKAKGKLSNTSAGNNYSRDQVYDDYGRIIKTTIGLDSDYVISVVYDTKGRVKSRHWPTGFALTMNYKSNGYLQNVIGSDGVKYIEIKTMDAFGNMIGYTYGNDIATTLSYDDLGRLTSIISGEDGIVQDKKYTFDKIGNILTRSDGNLDHVETFKYDGWNRLTENKLIGWTSQWKGVNYTNTQRVNYDVLGNITFKSDVGHYKYNTSPHAVSRVNGVKNYTYTYDANGNQISGAGRSIAYTSFNKVSKLEVLKDDETITYEYQYGSEHQRVREINDDAETYYINPEGSGLFYEKQLTAGGLTVTHKHYIKVAGILVAVKEQIESNGETEYETKYFHRDHLGSTDVITNDQGGIEHRNSYDAWGKRRHITPQSNGSLEDTDNSIVSALTRRGYTEHEHIDEAGLINMNGRLYDPLLGRFIQADIIIQEPEMTQNYNRYSYVVNNPLSYTDPTGHFFDLIIAVIFAAFNLITAYALEIAIVTTIAAVITGNPLLYRIAGVAWAIAIPGGDIFHAIGSGFMQGFTSSGGDINEGINQAISAGLMRGVGMVFGKGGSLEAYSGTPLQGGFHGVVGGINSVMQGGKFGNGFISASFTKMTSITGGIPGGDDERFSIFSLAAQSILGGTLSKLTGGKFANGAVTSAHGYLYNQIAGKISDINPALNYFGDAATKELNYCAEDKTKGCPSITFLMISLKHLASLPTLDRLESAISLPEGTNLSINNLNQFNDFSNLELITNDTFISLISGIWGKIAGKFSNTIGYRYDCSAGLGDACIVVPLTFPDNTRDPEE